MKKFRNRIWSFGVFCWVSIIGQSFGLLANGGLSESEPFRLFAMILLFIGWLYLKPVKNLAAERLNAEDIDTLKYYKQDSIAPPYEAYLHKTEVRMLQLEKHHLISQEYILPIPYICQIYHLLNIRHLESIHGFSLNGLKVVSVSEFQSTTIGGAIKFQTILDSPLNLLRIWRQPVVEVELILHTPYTVELSVPINGDKNITVIFNVLPLSHNDHKLFIDIYSNAGFPKILMQTLLHFASGLTLLEDLPYLRRLAAGKIHRSTRSNKGAHTETMLLFERFADLYGSSLEQPQSSGATELRPVPALGAAS